MRVSVSKSIDELKNKRKNEINILVKTKLALGLTYKGHTFQITKSAQDDMNRVQSKFNTGAVNAHGGIWRDVHNNNVPMTDTEVQDFFDTVFAHVFSIRQASWVHKDNIAVSNDYRYILDYDINGGWPV